MTIKTSSPQTGQTWQKPPSDENGSTSHSRPRRWILLSHGSRSFLLPSLRKDLDYHKMRLDYPIGINGDF
ncbi:MAG: hypothetical protein IM524_08620 [Pseudanabaena sp. M051S1SP1A06QC]|nr:hypothetical protein [Pseudanabaena sp. M051S1SP1A06QC]